MVFLVYTDMSSRGFIMGHPGVHAFLNGCYLVPRQLDLDCRWSIDWRKQDQGRNCFLCKVEFKTVGGIEVPKLAGDKTRQDNLHWEKRPCRSNPIQYVQAPSHSPGVSDQAQANHDDSSLNCKRQRKRKVSQNEAYLTLPLGTYTTVQYLHYDSGVLILICNNVCSIRNCCNVILYLETSKTPLALVLVPASAAKLSPGYFTWQSQTGNPNKYCTLLKNSTNCKCPCHLLFPAWLSCPALPCLGPQQSHDDDWCGESPSR